MKKSIAMLGTLAVLATTTPSRAQGDSAPRPLVAPDPRVRATSMADADALYPACVAMYTEEVGISPEAGGGADLYPSGTSDFTAYSESAFHVVRVMIRGGTLHADMIHTDGSIGDSFELTKNASDPSAAAPTAPPRRLRSARPSPICAQSPSHTNGVWSLNSA